MHLQVMPQQPPLFLVQTSCVKARLYINHRLKALTGAVMSKALKLMQRGL